MKAGDRILRFGSNEIDLQSYELRRAGRRVPISKLPLDLLILLLERRGALVTRAEIAAHLWPNPELVDTEQGINNAINRIRGLINDNPARPRYIETAIGRGYRFIGPVEQVTEPGRSEPELSKGPDPPPEIQIPVVAPLEPLPYPFPPEQTKPIRLFFSKTSLVWIGVTCSSLLLALWFWPWNSHVERTNAALQASQITTSETDNPVAAGAISPDGKEVAYADPDGLFLRVLKTGITNRVWTSPSIRAHRIAWFPDCLHLLLSGLNSQSSRLQIWSIAASGGPPRLIREDAGDAAPSPDGKEMAFTANDDSEIWVDSLTSGKSRLFTKAHSGEQFTFLFWSARGKRVSYQKRQYAPAAAADNNHGTDAEYRFEYGSRDARSGKELARVPGLRFDSACETQDGRLLYLRTGHPREGPLLGIWAVTTDVLTGRLLSPPHQLASLGKNLATSMSASIDGKKIAAVWERGQPDVYLAGLRQPGPVLTNIHRLTSDSKEDYPHAWTRDSQSVIFESDREGNYHLFRQSLHEHVPERLTDTPGQQVSAQLSPGGDIVLFDSLPERTPSAGDSLAVVGLAGGRPVGLPIHGQADEFRCPLRSGPCVLRQLSDQKTFVFYALDLHQGKGAELGRTPSLPGHFSDWALSPDGETVALPDSQKQPPVIRLVNLAGSGRFRPITEIPVKGIPILWNLTYSADGLGWFAEARTNGISSLVYIDAKGEARLLRETIYNTWGVPSPDGRKLAFVDYTTDRNLWLWQ